MSCDVIRQRRLRKRIDQMISSMEPERGQSRQAWEEKMEELKRNRDEREKWFSNQIDLLAFNRHKRLERIKSCYPWLSVSGDGEHSA